MDGRYPSRDGAAGEVAGRHVAALQLLTLAGSLFVMSLSVSFAFAVLPPIGRDMGLSEMQVSLILSPAALVFILSSYFWGSLSTRFGRKPVLLVATAGATSANFIFAWIIDARLAGHLAETTTFMLLALFRCTMGALCGGAAPAAQAYVADGTSADRRTSALATIGTGSALGLVAGPGIAAATFGIGATAPFYAAGMLCAVALLLVIFMLVEPPTVRQSVEPSPSKLGADSPWLLLLLIALTYAAYGILLQITAFRMQDEFNLTSIGAVQRAGLALMATAGGMVATQIAIAGIGVATRHSGKALVAGATWMLVCMAIVMLAGSYAWQLAAMAAFGIGMGAVLPSALGLLTLSAGGSADQGRIGGWSGATQGVGMGLAPPIAAWLYGIGPAAPYLFGLALLSVVIALAAIVSFGQR